MFPWKIMILFLKNKERGAGHRHDILEILN